jgi:endonuclease VIII
MEDPSLVIATEEFKPFLKRKILAASGTAKLPYSEITGTSLVKTRSWGKHFLLFFTKAQLRVHFLMFGSYRINDPREGREPKLELDYGDDTIYFYSCAIKAMPKGFEKAYDFSVDLMAK